MKALIIEDEKAAVRNLQAVLSRVAPEMEVIEVIDSVADALDWFATHPLPELAFVAIHLADGSAFELFEKVEIRCPVIFTTAYDEYALRAFKVNSIDYLLKPIGEEEMRAALSKLRHLCAPRSEGADFQQLIHSLRKVERYPSHFLIPMKGDKLLPLAVDHMAYCFIAEGQVRAVTDEGKVYDLPQTMDELTETLDPDRFFRANRQYLIARKAVRDIDLWFNNRLAINLTLPTAERIIVSKVRATEFKEWFMGGNK